jgi:hypothetical protein
MLTLILPALLLTGLQTAPDVNVARSAANISPDSVRGSVFRAPNDKFLPYQGFYKFQEGPSSQSLTLYVGPIGCAAQLMDRAKLKTVPTNSPQLTKPLFRITPAQP